MSEAIDMPSDLLESLRVITGDRPESFKKEFEPNLDAYQHIKSGTKHDEVLRKHESKKVSKLTNNKVYVFDLTSEDDARQYAEVLDVLGDTEKNNTFLSEPISPVNILLDASAPKGYRAITIVKTVQPVECLVRKKKIISVTEKIERK